MQKISRRKLFKMILGTVAVGSVAGCKPDKNKYKKNPYQYSIDSFKKIDPKLMHYKQITSLDIDLFKITSLNVSSSDQILITGKRKVVLFNSDLKELTNFTVSDDIHTAAFSDSDGLIIGFKNHIAFYNLKGSLFENWDSLGESSFIVSIQSYQNDILISDFGEKIVWHFNRDHRLIQIIGRQKKPAKNDFFILPSPYFDLKNDANGYWWIVNPGKNLLLKYDLVKKSIMSSWGSSSFDIGGFSGCCNPIYISILNNGNIITSEKGIARIKEYNSRGELLSVVAGPADFKSRNPILLVASNSKNEVLILNSTDPSLRIYKK